ncbi:tryptophan 7-halogenase [Alteromonadaceae bacterium BrNp21-10]|nr:tryptophan 7-halogenase [Alteromonadaceae bacterium BrNp21-10]
MSVSEQAIKSIVIVGGGTAGWMTAAAMAKHFGNMPVEITLVESSQLGTIGVGEATIPTLRRFYAKLGLTDIDVIKATNATCKLGIEFKDWHTKSSSFIHPFGLFGQPANNVAFHHYWLKLREKGDITSLAEYSLGVSLAQNNKFCLPAPKPSSPLAIFDWALHFDAGLFANLMRDNALANGAKTIDAKICDVKIDSTNGNISAITLEDGQSISADLFIDCSGFKGLLIEEALNTGYEDWSHWLLCDRAVAVQSESDSIPIPRTISTAHQAGWQWKIPLQTRTGNGHVYCSQFIDKQQATETLLANIAGKTLHEPREFSFTPGRRQKAWNKNCIAIGLASGFLEPLESTSIALIETAIERLLLTFDKPSYNQQQVERFNEVSKMEYERVRDFIILHYKANQRTDSEFWQICRDMQLPSELEHKMHLFKTQGTLERYPWEIFGPDSWLAIYHGFNYLPDVYDKKVDNMPLEEIQKGLFQMRNSIKKSVKAVPEHQEFLQRFGGYQPKPSTA